MLFSQFEINCEDDMRTWRGLIHTGLSHLFWLVTDFEHFVHLLFVWDLLYGQIGHIKELIFFYLKVCLFIWKQVDHLLLVNFKHRTRHNHLISKPIIILFTHILDRWVNILDSWWNDSLFDFVIQVSKHGVSFSASGLTISKNCWVESSDKVFDHLLTYRFVDLLLLCWVLEYVVVGKEIVLTQNLLLIDDCNFLVQSAQAILLKFLRSEPNESLDVELRQVRGLHLLLGKTQVVDSFVGLWLWTVSGAYFEGSLWTGLFESKPIQLILFGVVLGITFGKRWQVAKVIIVGQVHYKLMKWLKRNDYLSRRQFVRRDLYLI